AGAAPRAVRPGDEVASATGAAIVTTEPGVATVTRPADWQPAPAAQSPRAVPRPAISLRRLLRMVTFLRWRPPGGVRPHPAPTIGMTGSRAGRGVGSLPGRAPPSRLTTRAVGEGCPSCRAPAPGSSLRETIISRGQGRTGKHVLIRQAGWL